MAVRAAAELVAIDWGTSSLRGARLDAGGRLLEQRHAARGILTVERSEFAAVFEASFGDWMNRAGAFCIICGMAGSRQGWIEAPYCGCPAGADDLAAHLAWIEPGRISVVPGLSDEHDAVPDVLRGEETQIVGAMALLGIADGLFVLPGTHSKWATVERGNVTGFRTFMTGEFYALLSRHSILSRTLQDGADAPLDEAAFVNGVLLAARSQGLLHNAFSVRTLALFERLGAPALASHLSGLLIGEELASQSLGPGSPLVLIGDAALTRRYAIALAACGAHATVLGSEATWAGLHVLAQRVR